ncbi:hypothetical protein MLD38_017078 [Melastoma candidum]|uniref:Uncharacterized protein n=1 Tax=Melastoma candidum TaxID=119954 RepID=A0ACB9QRD0_9MYRT|nr:hypothetical protein MLD38_017078 [Melastoma candidum]
MSFPGLLLILVMPPVGAAGLVGYSAPLVSRGKDRDISSKHEGALPTIASPLPTPPLGVPRSLSIPSSASRGMSCQCQSFWICPRIQRCLGKSPHHH